jgi:hypothetical protein
MKVCDIMYADELEQRWNVIQNKIAESIREGNYKEIDEATVETRTIIELAFHTRNDDLLHQIFFW